MTFEEARAQFPVLERYAYLQAGSVGPLGRPTIEAMWAEEATGLAEGRGSYARFMKLLDAREQLRSDIAALVGVSADRVALTASTTDGCNIVLAGLDLRDGDEVITTTDEHFGLLGPLHTSRAKVVVVEPDPERIVEAVTPRTRLLALSHVLWTTGAVLPVHELRATTGLPILVDGAQSVGTMSVDAGGLDYYTVSGQKWLCGPEGTGALVVAEPDALRVARPSYLSQQAYEHDGVFVPKEGAARFDPNLIPGAEHGRAADGDPDHSLLGVRARRRARRALPGAPRRRRAGRDRAREPRDARLVAGHRQTSRRTSSRDSPRPA